jgi:hypothetical protein
LDLLPTLRSSTQGEWTVAERDAAEAGVGDVQAGGGTPFGGGSFSDGATWTATVQPPDTAVVEVDNGMVSFPMPDGTESHGPIQVWSFPVHTIITAITATDVNATTLRVTAGGNVMSEVAMTDVTASDRKSSFAGKAAASALVLTGPFEVDLLDVDGNVIDHFSSPVFST